MSNFVDDIRAATYATEGTTAYTTQGATISDTAQAIVRTADACTNIRGTVALIVYAVVNVDAVVNIATDESVRTALKEYSND